MPVEAAKDLRTLFVLTMNNMAQLRKKEGNLMKATEYLRTVIGTISFDRNEETAKLYVATCMNLSELCSATGDYGEAVRSARLAYGASEELLGSGSDESLAVMHAIACNNYAVQLVAEGVDVESAEGFCRKALTIVEGLSGEQSRELRLVFKESLKRMKVSHVGISENHNADETAHASSATSSVAETDVRGIEVLENSPQGPSELHRQAEVNDDDDDDEILCDSPVHDLLESLPASAREVTSRGAPVNEPKWILEDREYHRSEISVVTEPHTREGSVSQIADAEKDTREVLRLCSEDVVTAESENSSQAAQLDNELSSADPMSVDNEVTEAITQQPLAVGLTDTINDTTKQSILGEHLSRPEQSASEASLRSHERQESKWRDPSFGVKFFADQMANASLDDSRDLGSPKWAVRYDPIDESYVITDNRGEEWITRSDEQGGPRSWMLSK
ncbi:hypothetical protein Pmar_PMAR013836 [Perkinsus marinus ATCC 50983]|uniref:Uncharacterized protein n=1 Tax=Perkinsus marinus (strain ATCC 50983 / TXsc) TaxID=423536 RepID=C5L921_PERM5|nr:hypothetical protein Pmar_PMAR013836 [Perkinsus marinus ATCC 50983]EER06785.1 hypothetical protein Pmar_PMAR013836 [Perkinsus marinus ATCC 50983]|eukprot:XP_002774969.1 hypothetical protein Pmar_PMAR013836 [Perkinsus marinus ATCC 50983]